jgi:hypothetical protein
VAGSSEDRPRNPFRSEADAFRVLVIVVAATAVLVAVTLLTTPLVGALLMVALLAVAAWRFWGLLRDWRQRGSEPRRG